MFLTISGSDAFRCTVITALDLQKSWQGAVIQESKMLRTLFKSKI